MHNRHPFKWAIILVLTSIVLGCSTLLPQRTPAIIPPRTITATAETIQPSPVPPTSAPSPTPAPCPPQQNVTAPDRPTNFDDYAETLRAYLASGGDPLSLPAILSDWDAHATVGERFLQTDLDHDGIEDIIVAFVDPAAEPYPPAGTIAIYTCRDGTVRTLYSLQTWRMVRAERHRRFGHHPGRPHRPYLRRSLVRRAHLLAHAPRLVVAGHGLPDQIGGEFSFPYPNFALEDDHILVGGGGIGSVGAGPQRPVTTTLAWDGSVITTTATIEGPAHLPLSTSSATATKPCSPETTPTRWMPTFAP